MARLLPTIICIQHIAIHRITSRLYLYQTQNYGEVIRRHLRGALFDTNYIYRPFAPRRLETRSNEAKCQAIGHIESRKKISKSQNLPLLGNPTKKKLTIHQLWLI